MIFRDSVASCGDISRFASYGELPVSCELVYHQIVMISRLNGNVSVGFLSGKDGMNELLVQNCQES